MATRRTAVCEKDQMGTIRIPAELGGRHQCETNRTRQRNGRTVALDLVGVYGSVECHLDWTILQNGVRAGEFQVGCNQDGKRLQADGAARSSD